MLKRIAVLVAVVATLAGCASAPQVAVPLDKTALTPNGRVGVAVTKMPELTTHVPGAGCLLCVAVANGANRLLSEHAKSLPVDDVTQLKQQVADQLRAKGLDVVVIAEPVDLETLPKREAQPNSASRDFRALGQKEGLQKLLLIDVSQLGFERTYSAYFATSDPKALFRGAAYLVNLGTQAYEWYLPINVLKSAQPWDEPPNFPGLTNAYFQAVEGGKDAVLNALKD